MGKVLCGFILGVVLTGLGVALFDKASENAAQAVGGDTLLGPDSGPPESTVESSPRVVMADEIGPEYEAGALTVPAEGSRPTLEELEKRAADLNRAWHRAQHELENARNVERRASEPPPALPITLPAEFDWVSERWRNAHELIQREAIDPAWSAVTEGQLYRFFAERPEMVAEYGYPTVHCRTTRCQIQIVAYGINEGADEGPLAGRMSFQSAVWEIFEQPWAEQFGYGPNDENNRLGMAVWNNEDGVTTILWHLLRQQP